MARARKKRNHPWVAVAAICQMVLEDADKVFSLIRMVDLFTFPKPPDWDGKEPIGFPISGFLSFRSGHVKGRRTLRIYGVSPNGKRRKLQEMQIEFLGENSGVNVKMQILFTFMTEGTHWLDVYVDKWLATRIPVTIQFAPAPPGEQEKKE
jgi:hypothetical protein